MIRGGFKEEALMKETDGKERKRVLYYSLPERDFGGGKEGAADTWGFRGRNALEAFGGGNNARR